MHYQILRGGKIMLWIILVLAMIGLLGFPLIQRLIRFSVKLFLLTSKGIIVLGFIGLLWLIGFKGLIILIWTFIIIIITFTIKYLGKIYKKIMH